MGVLVRTCSCVHACACACDFALEREERKDNCAKHAYKDMPRRDVQYREEMYVVRVRARAQSDGW